MEKEEPFHVFVFARVALLPDVVGLLETMHEITGGHPVKYFPYLYREEGQPMLRHRDATIELLKNCDVAIIIPDLFDPLTTTSLVVMSKQLNKEVVFVQSSDCDLKFGFSGYIATDTVKSAFLTLHEWFNKVLPTLETEENE